MKKELAAAANLRLAFDEIAPGWYNYRHHTIFRRELENLALKWRGGRLLNAGCGHGADFLPFTTNFNLYGVDFAAGMIAAAAKYAGKYRFPPSLAVADITALPFGDGSFDYAIAVAVYHHLPPEGRLTGLRELHRVLKPGGEAFLTVWNRGQFRFWGKPRDLLIPWKQKNRTIQRYYHLFGYGEIAKLVRAAGFHPAAIFPEYRHRGFRFLSRNICLIMKKVDTV